MGRFTLYKSIVPTLSKYIERSHCSAMKRYRNSIHQCNNLSHSFTSVSKCSFTKSSYIDKRDEMHRFVTKYEEFPRIVTRR